MRLSAKNRRSRPWHRLEKLGEFIEFLGRLEAVASWHFSGNRQPKLFQFVRRLRQLDFPLSSVAVKALEKLVELICHQGATNRDAALSFTIPEPESRAVSGGGLKSQIMLFCQGAQALEQNISLWNAGLCEQNTRTDLRSLHERRQRLETGQLIVPPCLCDLLKNCVRQFDQTHPFKSARVIEPVVHVDRIDEGPPKFGRAPARWAWIKSANRSIRPDHASRNCEVQLQPARVSVGRDKNSGPLLNRHTWKSDREREIEDSMHLLARFRVAGIEVADRDIRLGEGECEGA
ncbi:hypothetical protein SAMN05216224_106242 [Thioclava dalianensis]|nr:hypothetical protein SAMN05216224_106242 [Thioclava dalianensis]